MKKKAFLVATLLGTAVLFFSCKQKDKHLDPNKQVDEGSVKGETYVSKDIGWTITIPAGWTVVSRDQMEVNEEKGKEAIKKAYKGDIDISGLKHLISFQKNRFNIFMSTSEPFTDESADAYENNCHVVDKLIYDAYASQGIKADTSTAYEVVHGHRFHVFHAMLYTSQGKVFLEQLLYSRLIHKKDFAVTINYNNEDDKKVMMDAFRNSTFNED